MTNSTNPTIVTTPDFDRAMSVPEFCSRHDISRSYFYKMAARGDAPEIVKLGRRTLIPAECARKWRERLTQPATILAQRVRAA